MNTCNWVFLSLTSDENSNIISSQSSFVLLYEGTNQKLREDLKTDHRNFLGSL